MAPHLPDGPPRLEPATRDANQVVDGGVAFEQVAIAPLDDPADLGRGQRLPQGAGHGNSVDHVAQGGEANDEDPRSARSGRRGLRTDAIFRLRGVVAYPFHGVQTVTRTSRGDNLVSGLASLD